MKNKKLLSREETLALIEKARSGDKAATDVLINANRGLIKKIAAKYADWSGLDLSDLMQEGALGLMKAAETFDAERAAFSTHAVNHIKWAILAAMNEDNGLISLPKDIRAKVLAIEKIRKKLNEQNDYDPNFDPQSYDEAMAVAEEAAIPVDEARELLHLSEIIKVQSLDDPVKKNNGENGDRTVGETLADDASVAAAELAAELAELKRSLPKLAGCLATLPPRSQRIIELRFGLEDGNPRTYSEISEMFGVTREKIIEIERKALRMLRHPSRQKLLRGGGKDG